MLVIRMQRTGRKGHANFRIVVQDSSQTPSSGKVIAQLGSFDPHTKALVLDNETTLKFINNGAQPSARVGLLLTKEGIKLPEWVTKSIKKTSAIRHPEKLRRNRPEEEKAPEPITEAVVADEVVETPTESTEIVEESTETAAKTVVN